MAGVAELGTSIDRAHASVDALSKSVDRCKWLAEEILRKLEKMVGDPEPVAFSGTTSATATPPPTSTTSTPPGAPPPGSRAVSGTPANLFDGAQKVFEGMTLRKMRENEQFRGFLSVRVHRIGKARRPRSSGAARAAFASAGAAPAPRPRITSPPPPLEGVPATASSTTSTDLTSSTTPVCCVRPRPSAVAASAASNRAGASRRSSACRGHDRPHKTGAPVPSAASASTRVMGPPPLEGGLTAGRAAPSPAPPPQRTPPSSSMSSSPSAVLSTEEGVSFTMSLKCSTLCLNPSEPITTPISEQRYITICTHAYPIDWLFPCLVAKMYESKGDENSVVLWLPFTYCWNLVFSRQPWPPPIQFRGTTLLIECSTVSRVFDRGKSSSDFIFCTVCGVWDLVQRKPPWPPPVCLAQLWSMVFCCAFTQYKMKWLNGGFCDLLLWLDKEKAMVSMLSPFLYGTVIGSTPIRLDFVLLLEAGDDLVVDTLVVADMLTVKVQLSGKYKLLIQLFAIQNIMDISMLLWGEWPDHDWYLIFGPRVNFQPYDVVIQSSQLPSSLHQKKGVRLWAEQIPFQHYMLVQQKFMCIQWKSSWYLRCIFELSSQPQVLKSSFSVLTLLAKALVQSRKTLQCSTCVQVSTILCILGGLLMKSENLSLPYWESMHDLFWKLRLHLWFLDWVSVMYSVKFGSKRIQPKPPWPLTELEAQGDDKRSEDVLAHLCVWHSKKVSTVHFLAYAYILSHHLPQLKKPASGSLKPPESYDIMWGRNREPVLELLLVKSGLISIASVEGNKVYLAAATQRPDTRLTSVCRGMWPQLSDIIVQLEDIQAKSWDPCGLQQRLEGKPHFKRWGMSWTRPSMGQWAGVVDWAASGPIGQLRQGDKRAEERRNKTSNRRTNYSSPSSVPPSRNLLP